MEWLNCGDISKKGKNAGFYQSWDKSQHSGYCKQNDGNKVVTMRKVFNLRSKRPGKN